MNNHVFTINPIPPFSLDLTAGYQTYFQGEVGADVFEGGVYRRVHEIDKRLFLLSIRDNKNVEKPQLEVILTGEEFTELDTEQAYKTVLHILATDVNLNPFYQTASVDPILVPIIKHFHGLHPPRMPTVFEGLIFAIAGQQISSTVARFIRTLIVKRFGNSMQLNGRVYYSFPSPQRILDVGINGLLEVKLSRRKAEYIIDIASKAVQGELELNNLESLSSENFLQQLDRLRGVGRWTAEWVLLRTLGRLDVFPAGDLALQGIISKCYFNGRKLSETQLRSFAERWAPFKALATCYLFAGRRFDMS